MKIDGMGLTYRDDIPEKWMTDDGAVETTRSVYEMWVADRIVFLVSVVHSDPGLYIQIGRRNVCVTGDWFISDGQAIILPHEVGGTPESPGDLVDCIDEMSIERYIYPIALIIVTCLYVDKS